MKLLIDVGNTAIKIAISHDKKIKFLSRFYLSDLNESNLTNILSRRHFDQVIICSVVPQINDFLSNYFFKKYKINPRFVKVGDYLDLKINIDDPLELGTDLYCDLIGAYKLYSYKNKPLLIIDLGTATKLLLLEDNKFSSCAILPGIEMSKKMLSSSTALLPLVSDIEIKNITESRNTVDVINSSTYYGHIEMINGLIKRFEKEINKKCIYIVTGGNSKVVIKDIKKPHVLKDDLIFYGMNEL